MFFDILIASMGHLPSVWPWLSVYVQLEMKFWRWNLVIFSFSLLFLAKIAFTQHMHVSRNSKSNILKTSKITILNEVRESFLVLNYWAIFGPLAPNLKYYIKYRIRKSNFFPNTDYLLTTTTTNWKSLHEILSVLLSLHCH